MRVLRSNIIIIIRDTLVIMEYIYCKRVVQRRIGKSERIRKDWGSIHKIVCDLHSTTEPEKFCARHGLGERTNVTFLRKTSTSTCKLRKNLTESACLSKRSKLSAVGREYSMGV